MKNPIRLSATPVDYRLPPPLLGQHTLAVLEELGMSQTTIDVLTEEKVVQIHDSATATQRGRT